MADRATSRRIGPGRVLVCCYVLFVVAAGARSAVQLGTHPDRAPVAYALSVLAALTYLVELVLLVRVERRPGTRRRRAAMVGCAVELAGVLAVGAASVLRPTAFPDATVWSWFGAGYGFVPLVLPVLAVLWLRIGVVFATRGP
ncbi:MAG: hypothetical protein WCA46_14260 [Actinocatenispora sp.]